LLNLPTTKSPGCFLSNWSFLLFATSVSVAALTERALSWRTMRTRFFIALLFGLGFRVAAQQGDSTIAYIEHQGYFVPNAFGTAAPPFLAYKKDPAGGLTISGTMPVYFFDSRGNMLPGCPYEYTSLPFAKKNRAVVTRNGLMGMIDQRGQVVIQLRFQRLELANHPAGWLRARLNGRWGLIDSTGHVQLEAKYDKLEPFSDGMAAVEQNEKWGFVDLTGHEAIAPMYRYVWRSFHEGFAAVDRATLENQNAVGFIDKHNRAITAFKYAYPFCVNRTNPHFRDAIPHYQFRHGYAMVRNKNCEIGVIDTLGQEVLPVRFYRIEITDSTLVGYRNKQRMTYKVPR
jgi:WG containing repeat